MELRTLKLLRNIFFFIYVQDQLSYYISCAFKHHHKMIIQLSYDHSHHAPYSTLIIFLLFKQSSKQTLENTDGAITNWQSRETDNIRSLLVFVLCTLCCQFLWIVFALLVFVLCTLCCQFLWIVFALLVFVLCTLCCQFLWIVFALLVFVLCTLCCQFLWIVFALKYTRRKQAKQKHNTICVEHHYTETNTNNVNKIYLY
jgi:hypothetical protein